jgi:hypothetical protein
MQHFLKDPQAVLDYYIDWTPLLGDDEIVTSTWVTPDTLTLSDSGILGSFTVIWVAGGAVDTVASATNHVLTAEGREDERTIFFVLRNL